MAPTQSSPAKTPTKEPKGKRNHTDAELPDLSSMVKKTKEDLVEDTAVNNSGILQDILAGEENKSVDENMTGMENADEEDTVIFANAKDWYTETLTKRLGSLLQISDASLDLYALRKIPNHLTWVKSGREFLLAKDTNAKPVTLFVPGTIARLWLFDVQGNPVKNPAVTMLPIDSRDILAMRELMRRYSRSDAALNIPSEMRASRLQFAPRVRGITTADVSQFDQVWDARKIFQSKDKMNHLQIEDLMENDVILLECKVTRFSPPRKSFKDTPTEWRVSFKLEGVHVLAQPPTDGEASLPISPFNFHI